MVSILRMLISGDLSNLMTLPEKRRKSPKDASPGLGIRVHLPFQHACSARPYPELSRDFTKTSNNIQCHPHIGKFSSYFLKADCNIYVELSWQQRIDAIANRPGRIQAHIGILMEPQGATDRQVVIERRRVVIWCRIHLQMGNL